MNYEQSQCLLVKYYLQISFLVTFLKNVSLLKSYTVLEFIIQVSLFTIKSVLIFSIYYKWDAGSNCTGKHNFFIKTLKCTRW